MSKHVKHVPKHRQAPGPSASARASRTAVRTTLVLSTLAVTSTGVAVAAGALSSSPEGRGAVSGASANVASPVAASAPDAGTAAAPAPEDAAQAAAERVEEREEVLTRSDRRAAADPVKEQALSLDTGNALSRTEDLSDEDPRTIGRALLTEFGFSSDQFGCLDSLWTRESNWTVDADNPTSSAYGIPQALPGSKMSSAGADWATNPVTQIRWGLGYIDDRYGSPCGAWAHSERMGWY